MLDATLRLVATEGLDAVRHRRVAEMAGVSLGSTTYHFASRDDLVEEAFLHYLDGATAALDEIWEAPTGEVPPARHLARFVRSLVAREFAIEGLVQAEYELILLATRSPRLAERLAAWEDAQAAQVEQFLRDTGALAPAEGSRMVLAVIRGLEVERLIHPTHDDDPTEHLAGMLAGLWPPPV